MIMNIVLDEGAFMPERAHNTDAGLDLKSPISFVVPAKGSYTVDTGVHVELPMHTAGFLKSKSGLNVNENTLCEGVVDVGYNGSIRAKLYNHGTEDVVIEKGQKITQLVILPIVTPTLRLVDKLSDTERGAGGFGSTGKF